MKKYESAVQEYVADLASELIKSLRYKGWNMYHNYKSIFNGKLRNGREVLKKLSKNKSVKKPRVGRSKKYAHKMSWEIKEISGKYVKYRKGL